MTETNQKSSYGQILKTASIMGGAAGFSLLLGMARVKFAAVLIGTSGVGLIASYAALQGVFATLAGLGLQSSAVRSIAGAVNRADERAVGRLVLALRRISWLTGLVGMVLIMLLSPLLSRLTFGHQTYTFDIAALGFVILFGSLSGGQMALIQGMRRIGDLARTNVLGAAAGTLAAIGFYTAMGMRGIIPSIVAVSATQLALSWYFARQVPVPHATLTWRQTFVEAGGMVQLGLVMMWSGLMGSAVAYLSVALITEHEGLEAVGLFSAAFALSGMFINFVLGAMAADYFPRLTGIAHDKLAMVRMANEQTEVGLLLALPGLIATMALAPWTLQIFFAREFLGAVDLLQLFILGCLGRVISWPLGYVMLALGKGRWFLLTETSFNLVHIALVALGLRLYGIEGVAIAFGLMYVGYTAAVYAVSRRLIAFSWSPGSARLVLFSILALGALFTATRFLALWPATVLGLTMTLVACTLCLRSLIARVGSEHRIVQVIAKLPGGKLLIHS